MLRPLFALQRASCREDEVNMRAYPSSTVFMLYSAYAKLHPGKKQLATSVLQAYHAESGLPH